MTGIVNGLERNGFVRRRPHASDGRAVLIGATAAGRRLLKRARRRRIEAIAAKLEDLSEHQLELLWQAGQLLEERFALRPWSPV